MTLQEPTLWLAAVTSCVLQYVLNKILAKLNKKIDLPGTVISLIISCVVALIFGILTDQVMFTDINTLAASLGNAFGLGQTIYNVSMSLGKHLPEPIKKVINETLEKIKNA